ncbi:hypothetical protein HBH47_181800 [Parastagonospora nodorum]|nr:hypothetical protein HBH47_181800 [Parastagonospora nodorum]KAH5489847.1 hypothetical protein HBI29_205050 [Parastagonospora nodorum]KAH6287710.1 hypothetical protein HBI39_221900 [Parastagonospora nodorum]
MSGIEVAGLVFGILPILIQVVKSYSDVADSLHTFRHYSKEVKSVSLQLKVQNGIFLNHCRLLLRLVEDDKAAEDMLEDGSDQRWTSKELNDKLNVVLKDSLELSRSIIEETKDVIDEMKEEMRKFDHLKAQKKIDESFRAAIKRLRGAVQISFNKSKYERCLASLRDHNDDLNTLRSQIRAFQHQATTTAGATVRHKVLPDRFQSIQSASQKLHEALCSAWCCDDAKHRGHFAKLCLDAEADTEVRLDIAISCHDTFSDGYSSMSIDPPIWLYVQSMSVTNALPDIVASQTMDALRKAIPVELLSTASAKALKKKASSDLPQASARPKKKRVHFVDPSAVVVTTPIAKVSLPDFNLCQTKSICHYLKRTHGAHDSSTPTKCLGYLETPCHKYKHRFYLRDRAAKVVNAPDPPEQASIFNVFDIMQHEVDDVLEPEDQLKLALKTALATLQYNDTPWLAERWRLGNMSFFGHQRTFDDATLKTLHLSSQISWPHQPTTATQVMEGVLKTDDVVSDEIKYGINNLPLFFLGVALLEIAHWKPLESKMITRDQLDPVYTARRLAQGRAPLGPEYQKIAQKCLQCNFGFGTKLNSKSLQTAVYNDVVCELEGMIERLAV